MPDVATAARSAASSRSRGGSDVTTPSWCSRCILTVAAHADLVLAAQNSVSADDIGSATATNNYCREVGATLGVAVFGTLFTSRLAENLTGAVGGNAEQAAAAGITSPDTLTPAAVERAGEPLRGAIVDGYADALAPVFGYLLPFLAVALVLALVLREIPLSDTAGMIARGEAVGSEDDLPGAAPVATTQADGTEVVVLPGEVEVDAQRV